MPGWPQGPVAGAAAIRAAIGTAIHATIHAAIGAAMCAAIHAHGWAQRPDPACAGGLALSRGGRGRRGGGMMAPAQNRPETAQKGKGGEKGAHACERAVPVCTRAETLWHTQDWAREAAVHTCVHAHMRTV